jgi:hypothetical protein
LCPYVILVKGVKVGKQAQLQKKTAIITLSFGKPQNGIIGAARNFKLPLSLKVIPTYIGVWPVLETRSGSPT